MERIPDGGSAKVGQGNPELVEQGDKSQGDEEDNAGDQPGQGAANVLRVVDWGMVLSLPPCFPTVL